jgi:hypothetical protein
MATSKLQSLIEQLNEVNANASAFQTGSVIFSDAVSQFSNAANSLIGTFVKLPINGQISGDGDVAKSSNQLLTSITPVIFETAEKAKDGIISGISKAKDGLIAGVSTLTNFIQENGKNVTNAITNTSIQTKDGLIAGVEKTTESFSNTIFQSKDILLKPVNFISDKITEGATRVKEWALSPITRVKEAFGNMGTLLKEKFGNIGKSVKGALGGVFGAMFGRSNKKEQTKLLEEIRDTEQEGFASTKSKLQSLLDFFSGDKLQNIENMREQGRLLSGIADSIEDVAGGEGGAATAGPKKKSLLSRILNRGSKTAGGAAAGALGGVGKGIAGIGKGIGKGLGGILIGIARGLKALSNPRLLIGVGVLGALGGAIFISAKAFKEFGDDINWKNVLFGSGVLAALAGGLALLGKFAPQMLIGSLALVAISGAIFIAGKAFQQFTDIDWKGVAIGIGVLGLLAAAAGLLSSVAIPIMIGAAAIGVLGLALIPAAKAFEIFSRAIEPMAKGFEIVSGAIGTFVSTIGDALVKTLEGIVTQLFRLSEIGLGGAAGLLGAAVGITAVGAALVAFGAGQGLAGFLSFLGGDPLKKFIKFAEVAPGLKTAAEAISDLNSAVQNFTMDGVEAMAKGLDILMGALKRMSDGIFKKDPLKPLRELAKFAPTLDVSMTGFSEMGKGMKAILEFVQADINIDPVILALEQLTFKLFVFKNQLNDISAPQLEALSLVLSQATAFPQLEAQGISASAGRINGDDIYAGGIANEMAKNQNAAAMTSNASADFSRSEGNKSQTVNNVTYNQSNHIDETLQNVVYMNRF